MQRGRDNHAAAGDLSRPVAFKEQRNTFTSLSKFDFSQEPRWYLKYIQSSRKLDYYTE